jgi:hypothetical protein
LFPEFFGIMADYNHLSEAEAIRELADTEAVKLPNLLFRTTLTSLLEACLYRKRTCI